MPRMTAAVAVPRTMTRVVVDAVVVAIAVAVSVGSAAPEVPAMAMAMATTISRGALSSSSSSSSSIPPLLSREVSSLDSLSIPHRIGRFTRYYSVPQLFVLTAIFGVP